MSLTWEIYQIENERTYAFQINWFNFETDFFLFAFIFQNQHLWRDYINIDKGIYTFC